MAKKQISKKSGTKSAKSSKKIILLVVELLVLVVALAFLGVAIFLEEKGPERVNIEVDDLDIHVDVQENETMKV